MKKNYSEPKIYTGGIDIRQWSKLSKKEKTIALAKHGMFIFHTENQVQENWLDKLILL